jgi:predicted nuclease of predicted toxin-antitoxin system
MKLLLDQGLPRSTCDHLPARGIIAEHASSLGLATATDDRILEYARAEDFVIVTLDADFHQLLAVTEAISPSAIRIQIEGLRAEPLAAILQQV